MFTPIGSHVNEKEKHSSKVQNPKYWKRNNVLWDMVVDNYLLICVNFAWLFLRKKYFYGQTDDGCWMTDTHTTTLAVLTQSSTAKIIKIQKNIFKSMRQWSRHIVVRDLSTKCGINSHAGHWGHKCFWLTHTCTMLLTLLTQSSMATKEGQSQMRCFFYF